ncbi:hypothetical protein BGW38_006612 [Lunasporangiospora selenospora]|uniref:Uncharacterized protein n=1 Tax=Lunasporangiospora selenospora TaxID=979761 RepID=A0A9P6KGT1_9FUNG|nr:hypothetical protein BGW38_006612 [Lunasporangiospora selenospora]
MEDVSKKRKERLEQLRKRKLESTSNGDSDHVSLSFRNYTPINSELSSSGTKIATSMDLGETVESKMEGVVERVILEDQEKRGQDVDIFNLAPKAPNWDLKRDIEPRILKLEKKTRAAIIEIIRKERPSDLILN